MKGVRGYIFSRSFLGERVPQHVQNIVIRDYCQRNGLHYLLSATEYAMEDCHLILQQVLDELANLDGMILYSLFQLPMDSEIRNRFYDRILSSQKNCYFAVEGLQLNNREDAERIENLWKIKLILPYCLHY
ncbi:LIC12192 family sporadic carbohydrate cluster protein [Leptospira alstonii]|uniref:Sporadic carbohydrate cluster protein, LIC12192 family n=2 Tax=Leptospira alstonii TaxID=28452 RepID=M6CJK8_9LEPT|nr:LIC12192 family sporadic carbohydrate cluster protein [Leptospira alstonii]EMJ92077.1 sporadic carbohydrate cluster protein, LIC12192 family [Leptospira alstonii serovar Sichuan str. 79601]EQA80300.1 sporadic carbohydrate cluster protein, TIGR04323 family [Leptospira alstonii serovar Pingchang str. 80-412]